MEYVDLYFPVMQGFNVRIGRFICHGPMRAEAGISADELAKSSR
jgi:hypothetical protein